MVQKTVYVGYSFYYTNHFDFLENHNQFNFNFISRFGIAKKHRTRVLLIAALVVSSFVCFVSNNMMRGWVPIR